MRIRTLDIDLADGIEPIRGMENYGRLYALVRYQGRPLGWVDLHNEPKQDVIAPERLREAITADLNWELLSVVLGGRVGHVAASEAPLPPISVVVCAHGRTDRLARCLKSLLSLHYVDYEVIVVDSAPFSADTARLAAGFPVRYVREEQPGRSRARNRGIVEADSEIIAFIEDDASADRRWLSSIAKAFARPGTMAVTGLTAPLELETDAQVLYEFYFDGAERSYGGLRRKRYRRTILRSEIGNRELLWAASLGGGTNMAFRRELFAAVGPFDVNLDASRGSIGLWNAGAGRGSGAIEMLHRVVARGHVLVYEPAALVWSTHQREFASLRHAVYHNAKAFGAYLITSARDRAVARRSVLSFAIREWLGRWMLRRLCRRRELPPLLIAAELAGALASPLAYVAAQRHARWQGQSDHVC